jgi:hypothetical protein
MDWTDLAQDTDMMLIPEFRIPKVIQVLFVCQCGIYLVENWNKNFQLKILKEKELSISLLVIWRDYSIPGFINNNDVIYCTFIYVSA